MRDEKFSEVGFPEGPFDWSEWSKRNRKIHADALAIDCPFPKCGAKAGEPCINSINRRPMVFPSGAVHTHPSRRRVGHELGSNPMPEIL